MSSLKTQGKSPASMKKCFIRNIRGEKTALTPRRRKRHLQTETLVNEEIEIEIDWVNQFSFFFCEGTTEVRFVERIVHRHLVQNFSCRNKIIEQIFAWTGIKFLEKKTTYFTLYSKLNSKETSTPSEAYCTVLNYIWTALHISIYSHDWTRAQKRQSFQDIHVIIRHVIAYQR